MKEVCDLINKKLEEYKAKIIDLCEAHTAEDVKAWGQAWKNSNSEIFDYSHLLVSTDGSLRMRSDFMPIVALLYPYREASKSLIGGDLPKAIENLLLAEFMFGKNAGVVSERTRVALLNNRKRHEENTQLKKDALSVYKKLELHKVSTEKAAEELTKFIPLKQRTLKTVIAKDRNTRRLVKKHAKELMENLATSVGENLDAIKANPQDAEQFAKFENQVEIEFLKSFGLAPDSERDTSS